MENRKLHWGIIGCGNVTEQKSGPAFYTLPNTELVAVMRRDAAKAADYARRHHVPAYYTNAADLLNAPNVEAVYIATPPSSHATLAIQAMQKGKAVYVEKPMATSYADCLTMANVSQQTGQPLYIAYYRRAQAYFLKIKEIISSGILGEILHAGVRLIRPASEEDRSQNKPWRLDPEQSGGGYFVDMGSHQLDLLLFLFGSIKSWQAEVCNKGGFYQAEDYVDVDFLFQSGLRADGTWNFAAHGETEEDSFTITGTNGTLYFSTFTTTPIRLITTGEQIFTIPKPAIVEAPMIEQITNNILSGNQNTRNLADAIEVSRLIEGILLPYYQVSRKRII